MGVEQAPATATNSCIKYTSTTTFYFIYIKYHGHFYDKILLFISLIYKSWSFLCCYKILYDILNNDIIYIKWVANKMNCRH